MPLAYGTRLLLTSWEETDYTGNIAAHMSLSVITVHAVMHLRY